MQRHSSLLETVRFLEARVAQFLDTGGKKSAVIVVDMQNDFIPIDSILLSDRPNYVVRGGKIVPEPISDPRRDAAEKSLRMSAFSPIQFENKKAKHEAVVANYLVINRIQNLILRRHADLLVFSMDNHTADHISFEQNKDAWNDKLADASTREAHSGASRYPPHCVQGTWGQEIVGDLRRHPVVVNKILDGTCRYVLKGGESGMEGYSAFFKGKGVTGWEQSPAANTPLFTRLSSGLHELLQNKGIGVLFVCGTAQNICVCDTVLDAQRLGYITYLVDDASMALPIDAPPNILLHDDTLQRVRNAGVSVTDTRSVPVQSGFDSSLLPANEIVYQKHRNGAGTPMPSSSLLAWDDQNFLDSKNIWDGF